MQFRKVCACNPLQVQFARRRGCPSHLLLVPLSPVSLFSCCLVVHATMPRLVVPLLLLLGGAFGFSIVLRNVTVTSPVRGIYLGYRDAVPVATAVAAACSKGFNLGVCNCGRLLPQSSIRPPTKLTLPLAQSFSRSGCMGGLTWAALRQHGLPRARPRRGHQGLRCLRRAMRWERQWSLARAERLKRRTRLTRGLTVPRPRRGRERVASTGLTSISRVR